MKNYKKNIHARHFIFLLIVIFVLGYFVFEAQGVFFAPSLYIFEPKNGDTFQTTRIHIAGKTDAGARMLVNGKEFSLKKDGEFDGMLTLDPGYNEIGFLARDRLGHETRKVVKVIVQ
ncbi:MAG: hypothetical protein AAB795_01075 [Patescibacteria group bacterium]